MSESQSNIGNEEQSYEQSYQQQSQSYVPFEDANAGIKSELHTIVDKLQLDEPPSAQKGRPLWQRVLSWAVPLWLVAFFVVWCYNARVDTCGGAKVIYRGNVLCITSERDFLLLNETYETEFLARDTSEPMPIDSLNQKKYDDLTETIKSKYADTTAQDADTRTRLTFLNALRGNGMDSASYCRNLAMGYYNFAVNYLNKGKNDSACLAYRFLKDWHWKDSVLTKAELAVLAQICENKERRQVDLSIPSVPIKNIGVDGAANPVFACLDAFALLSKQKYQKTVFLSSRFIINSMNGKENKGFNVPPILDFLIKNGSVEESFWQFQPNDFKSDAPPIVATAPRYKIKNYQRLPITTDIFKKNLAQGQPIILVIQATENLYKLTGQNVLEIGGKDIGKDALCLVGFDDDKKLFKFKNMWGMGWGDRGYGYMPYDDMTKWVKEAYTISLADNPSLPKDMPQQKQQNIPPQYKEPVLPTSKAPDLNIGNLRTKRLENIENVTRNAQTGAETDPKAQQRIIPVESITTKVGNVSFDMVKVVGGTFKMGSEDKDAGTDEKPVHSVTLSDFYIGKYEVTQKQWRDVMGSDPSYNKKCDNCPVEQVSWNDIQEFLKKLNSQSKTQFRLPTEAEW